MGVTVLPHFGAAGVDTRSRGRATDILEFMCGVDIAEIYRTETGSLSDSKTILAYGIECTNPLDRTLESASLSEQEEVETHEAWTGLQPVWPCVPGSDPNKLVYVDAFLILRKRTTMNVSGKGDMPVGYEENKHGQCGYSLEIEPELDSTGTGISVAITDAIYRNPQEQDSLTDWRTFTLELSKVEGQTDGTGATHLITLDPSDVPPDLLATNYTISRTTTLNATEWATKEISIEETFGSAIAGAWPT